MLFIFQHYSCMKLTLTEHDIKCIFAVVCGNSWSHLGLQGSGNCLRYMGSCSYSQCYFDLYILSFIFPLFQLCKDVHFFLPTAVHRTTPQPLIIKPTISSERQKSTMGKNFHIETNALFLPSSAKRTICVIILCCDVQLFYFLLLHICCCNLS